ncbi:calcium and integrin-binding protein 1 [Pyxicephalus adspersus]|uniref:calcium and integrin-binding protein 1 n=1 Tax=Pyxicephalus adspersus TaxID=30357 RepID=UPI003B5CCC8D
MGGSSSQLSKQLINEYQELTYLTKQEILLAYKRYGELLPKESRNSIEAVRVPKDRFLTLPELKANPFKHRICHVFSTSKHGDDSMSFEDFLDMLSAFSESATLEIKSQYIHLQESYPNKTHLHPFGSYEFPPSIPFSPKGLGPTSSILEESDIDKDGTINHSEFQHVVSRSPDFVR